MTSQSAWTPDKEAQGQMMISITMPLSSNLINIIFRFKLSASMGGAGGRNKQNHRGTYPEIVVVRDRQEVSRHPKNTKGFEYNIY